jgi:hypothetical protein
MSLDGTFQGSYHIQEDAISCKTCLRNNSQKQVARSGPTFSDLPQGNCLRSRI